MGCLIRKNPLEVFTMQEVENILDILKQTKEALVKDDPSKIRELSNRTINTASLTQDPDNIAVAVIVYSLSKITERRDYRELRGWTEFSKKWNYYLDLTIESIEKKKWDQASKNLEQMRKEIGKLSGKFKKYVQDVFRRASINKASRIYEHGISMEQTAKLLGITMWELADYAGQTGISDVPLSRTLTAKSRIKLAQDFFK